MQARLTDAHAAAPVQQQKQRRLTVPIICSATCPWMLHSWCGSTCLFTCRPLCNVGALRRKQLLRLLHLLPTLRERRASHAVLTQEGAAALAHLLPPMWHLQARFYLQRE